MTFGPLVGDSFRMDHVWEKTVYDSREGRNEISDWKLILVTVRMPVPVTLPLSPLTGHAASDSGDERLCGALPECFGRT